MARTAQSRVKKAKMPETPCSPTPGDPRFSRETPEKLLQEILTLSTFAQAAKRMKARRDIQAELNKMAASPSKPALSAAEEKQPENVTVTVSSRVSGRTSGD